MDKFYLTTAIAYVNAPPHIGHALEFIQADALARFSRLKAMDTYFLFGTDEHGVKVFTTAEERGIETQKFVDQNAEHFMALQDILHLSNDDFIRTTQARHKAGASKIWNKMLEKGDIYKDQYVGNYCVGCETFIPEKNLDENGHCPIHKKKPQELKEENYFFRLSKYSDAIKKAIESDELRVVPEMRKNEMLNIIGEEGLRDVSFSRPKTALPWGIEVPNDPEQVMYVWCDALSNYITALDYEKEGELYKKYWPANAHIIGKDILRFHAGVWIGMLMSAGLETPKAVYVHGFVTSEGQKMSKSLGNVVDPLEYVEKYGIDAMRYYLLREIPTTDDGDFSHQRFVDVHNSELANGLGNLVNRVTMMTEKYVDGVVPDLPDSEFDARMRRFVDDYIKHFEGYNIKKAIEFFVDLVNLGNKYIDDKKPWVMAKEGDKELGQVLRNLLQLLAYAVLLISPILPQTAEKMAAQIGLDMESLSLSESWTGIKAGEKVAKGEPLFPRLEE